jgi:putative phosphoribosyl transferase
MPETHVKTRTSGPTRLFADRLEAGAALVEFIDPPKDPDALVLALPRGGVPVARPVADRIGCRVTPVAVRKLPIPQSPEMGFGAVTLDGTMMMNRPVMESYGIERDTARRVVEHVHGEVVRRAKAFPGAERLPDLTGRTVYLIDDGLATGYTMLAAASMAAAREPDTLVLGVPVAPKSSLDRVTGLFDRAFCLAEQSGGAFAVASFYGSFPDLTDREVVALLG